MILNINKPLEWSSFDVVKKIRSGLGIKKVGHAGTLDPLATGVLIILTNKDTKKQQKFMQMPKEYEFEMFLGVTSPTYDLEGPLDFTEGFTTPSENEVLEAFSSYKGTIQQKVPPFSAVKHKGKPLYKYAREGKLKEDMIPTKEVTIYDLELLEYVDTKQFPVTGKGVELPFIKGRVNCSKGTYIRSLVYDVGKDLGMGAVLSNLVRTKVGPYTLENSLTIDQALKP
ncbi:tRNA pseudouridine(55) synthase TruB [candidate division WWE3 bacterium]|nr:tRNA pseudouridine(55) synthase TruB [candidate division WWE3 bacterium]